MSHTSACTILYMYMYAPYSTCTHMHHTLHVHATILYMYTHAPYSTCTCHHTLHVHACTILYMYTPPYSACTCMHHTLHVHATILYMYMPPYSTCTRHHTLHVHACTILYMQPHAYMQGERVHKHVQVSLCSMASNDSLFVKLFNVLNVAENDVLLSLQSVRQVLATKPWPELLQNKDTQQYEA